LQRLRTTLFDADEEEPTMNQSRVNPGKALSKSRNRRRLRSPATVIARSSSPLDALV
jgi:hypothetical protein